MPFDNDRCVEFRFQSPEAKKKFLYGLYDGFGENVCELLWNTKDGSTLETAHIIDVTVYDDPNQVIGGDDDSFDDYGLEEFKDDEELQSK